MRTEIDRRRSREDFAGAPLLTTRRLLLRELRQADAPYLVDIDRDPDVTRWLLDERVRNLLQAWKLVADMNALYRRRPGLGLWLAIPHEEKHPVGYFSLMPVTDSEDVELGVRLYRASWGKHYALEAGRALCDHAFERLSLDRLVAFCHPDNRVVPLLLRRLGFDRTEQTTHFGRSAQRLAMTAAKWQATRPRPTPGQSPPGRGLRIVR